MLLERVVAWARAKSDVRGVALVGSWARGAPGMASDVDLILLTAHPEWYTAADDWIEEVVGEAASVVRTQRWGPELVERRLRLESGLEVEFGFASPTWASTDPVDPGTARVVRDGYEVLFDADDRLQRLADAVRVP